VIQEFEPVHVKIAPQQSWEIEKLAYFPDGSRTDDSSDLQQQNSEE
jgi:hypothetical protein